MKSVNFFGEEHYSEDEIIARIYQALYASGMFSDKAILGRIDREDLEVDHDPSRQKAEASQHVRFENLSTLPTLGEDYRSFGLEAEGQSIGKIVFGYDAVYLTVGDNVLVTKVRIPDAKWDEDFKTILRTLDVSVEEYYARIWQDISNYLLAISGVGLEEGSFRLELEDTQIEETDSNLWYCGEILELYERIDWLIMDRF